MIIPKKSIVIYSDNDDGYHFYAEVSDIDKKGRRRNTRPMSEDELESIAALAKTRTEVGLSTFSGLIPDNVVKYNNGLGAFVVWTEPAKRRNIQFKILNKISSYTVDCPSVIYRVNQYGRLSIFFYFDEVLSLETKLYKPPFPNGCDPVCLGGNRLPSIKHMDDVVDRASIVYWSSFFNTDYSTGLLKNDKDHFKYYKSRKGKPILEKHLCFKKKLKELL